MENLDVTTANLGNFKAQRRRIIDYQTW